jgi:PAS domain S-box-containing protein
MSMIYENRTNVQLIHDLNEIHKKIFELETQRTDAHETEEELKELSFQLGERFKELTCLCEIYKLFQKPEVSLHETLQGIVDLIPPAYQYPDITCARITLENKEFTTPHFKESVFKQARSLVLNGSTIGAVEVYYEQKMPECAEGPFLKEEVSLLNAIVAQLQTFIEDYHIDSQIRLTQFTMDTAGEAIVWVRQDGHYHYANQLACSLLGYSREELFSMSVADIPDTYKTQGFDYYWEKLKKEGALKHIVPYRTGTGDELFLEFRCSYLEFRGREYGCAFFHDISDKIRADEQAKKSNVFLEDIFSAIADGFLVTHEGKVLRSNRVAEKILGYQEGELCGKNMAEFIPDDKAHAPIRTAIRESHGTGETLDIWETDFCKKDGGAVPVEFSLSYLRESKNITGAVVSFRDITERKRTQALLHRFAVAMQQTIDGVAIADLEGNILFANKSWAGMHGYTSPEELVGSHLKVFHTQQQLEQDVLPFLDLTNKNGSHQGTVGHATREGMTFPTWMTTTILKNDVNDPIGIVGIARDTTDRDRILEERNQATLYLENIYQTLGEGLVISDMTGHITRTNRMFEEMVGYSHEELIGKHFSMLCADRYKGGGNPFSMQEFFVKGILKNFPFHYKRKDGSTFPAENNIVLFKNNDGAPQGAISSIRDITERQQTNEKLLQEIEDRKAIEKELRARDEELQEVNQALKVLLKRTEGDKREIEERILFNVNELVISYIDKLKNSSLDERQKTYVNIIESNLNNIISPFGQKLSVKYAALTPSEIHIANLIKEGKATKEIADIMHLSHRTVDFHRKNIRHKLGIRNAKANLRSMLLSLQ